MGCASGALAAGAPILCLLALSLKGMLLPESESESHRHCSVLVICLKGHFCQALGVHVQHVRISQKRKLMHVC